MTAPNPDDLPPEAHARLTALTQQLTSTARELFLAGVRIGASAPTESTGTVFARWRRECLARLTPGSWKHSIVDLVPGPRFRPFEIYTKQRDELQRRHPEHNNLNVGTHNALGDLMRDGIIAKIEDGVYAPAFDGVPLSADAGDPSAFYRPRVSVADNYAPASRIADSYALLLGYAHWTFAVLQWNLLHLGNTYAETFLNRYAGLPSEIIAEAFRNEIATGENLTAELAAIATGFAGAEVRRRALAYAQPCTRPDGTQGFTYPGGCSDAMDWSPEALVALCQSFEEVSLKANRLLHARLRAS